MGVLMQAFYWDCPRHEGQEFGWWPFVRERVAELKQAGFTALWLPPASKGLSQKGMGYDPYDYYDLGEFDQKGGVATWFGTKSDLLLMIERCHDAGIEVYADLVLNHSSGADEQEFNPITGEMVWTRFRPRSDRFPRDWNSFHPSDFESWDDATFEGMPDLCHRNPAVYGALLGYAKWLVEEIGIDGFRYDMVKGYGGWMVNAIQEYRYCRDGASYRKPFGVVEHWSDHATIMKYVNGVNYFSDNEVSAFDFPLRYRLKALCDTPDFDLREITRGGTVQAAAPFLAVTFVENHDTARSDPLVRDKMLAYAYILTHEGYPCVFWQDYYNFELARRGSRSGVEALVGAHEKHARGQTDVLYVDPSLYIMQRRGVDGTGGLVFVLNSRRDGNWRGETVQTGFPNARFEPLAFHGEGDPGVPGVETTDPQGRGDFWAAPRGYTVYAPVA